MPGNVSQIYELSIKRLPTEPYDLQFQLVNEIFLTATKNEIRK